MIPHPVKIRVDKPRREVVIQWSDGTTHHFPWDFLRAKCPSATERASRESAAANPLQVLDKVPNTELVSLKAVGNYALSPVWGDGHAVGIYTWEYLRELAHDPRVGQDFEGSCSST